MADFFQTCPLVLSVLCSSYAFVEKNLDCWCNLRPQVWKELDTIPGFIYLVEIDFSLPSLSFARLFFCFLVGGF